MFSLLNSKDSWEWRKIAVKGKIPINRSSHTAIILDQLILIYGGMSDLVSAFDDVHVFDVGE